MVDLCESVQACGTEMQKQQFISCGGYIVIKQFKNGGCDSSLRLDCGHEQNLLMTHTKDPFETNIKGNEAEGCAGCQ